MGLSDRYAAPSRPFRPSAFQTAEPLSATHLISQVMEEVEDTVVGFRTAVGTLGSRLLKFTIAI